jgi:hypothetical protein
VEPLALWLWVSGFGFRVDGVGFQVLGFGFHSVGPSDRESLALPELIWAHHKTYLEQTLQYKRATIFFSWRAPFYSGRARKLQARACWFIALPHSG